MPCGRIHSLHAPTPYSPETIENPKLGLAAEMLRRWGTVRLTLRGTSMLPSLWPGDLLTIQSAAYDEVVRGDIVLVMRDNRSFVHRLVESRPVQGRLSWITRGDAMPHNDPPLTQSELLGRVSGIRRANRSFVPSRRLSLFRSALAWMLCRWERFRNLTLRIHAVFLQADLTRARQLVRGVFGKGHGFPGASPVQTPHP
jgi:hypothetical protein